MEKQIAIELKEFVNIVAQRFSKSDRITNYNNEIFELERIIISSEHSASVVFKKSGGKTCIAFFYYINKGLSKGWKYFFPTDSHITGMRNFEFQKLMVEDFNFDKNFI
jgi:hypothetical protein